MTAYAIGQLTIHNKDWMEQYTAKIGPLLKKYQGHIIAKGAPTQLEGQATTPHVALCIEFTDKSHALAWYESDENQALVKLRQSGSDFELLLVDGI